jgi:hypothetical protein
VTIASISAYSTTKLDNDDVHDVPLDPGQMKPSDVNDAFQYLMADIASYTRLGSDLASATTLNLDSIDTLWLAVTGTTTTTAVTLTAGHVRFVRATGAWQLTASATLIVNGSTSVNFTTVAGDLLYFQGFSASTVRVWIIGRGVTAFLPAISSARTTLKVNSSGGGLEYSENIVQPSTQATTSGSSKDFTSIPSNVRRITVQLTGFGTNGTAVPQVLLGDSGGPETSGYTGTVSEVPNGAATAAANFSTGFNLASGWVAAARVTGNLILTRFGSTSEWVLSGCLGREDATSIAIATLGGRKTTSGTLDRVRLITTDTMAAGAVGLTYEI